MFQFIYTEKTDCTYPPMNHFWKENQTNQKQISQNIQAIQCSAKQAQLYIKIFVTAQCWGWGWVWVGGDRGRGGGAGPKRWTFTIESLGTDKGVLKSIAGKQTDACLFPSAAEHPSLCKVWSRLSLPRDSHYWTCVSKLPFSWPSS